MQPGEISEPFRTRFGVHLLTVTDRKPGDLSLEDVRGDVLAAMSRALWEQQAGEERARARIEWRAPR
jgi:parvulin-like peptidyl-prolyl isomerase